MLNESENDVHMMWEEQPREAKRISLDEIHAKARRAETRRRQWKPVGTIFFILLVIENSVEAIWPGQNMMERVGDLLIVAALFYIFSNTGNTHELRQGLKALVWQIALNSIAPI